MCDKCNNTGVIVSQDDDGYVIAEFCECQKKKDFENRMRKSGLLDLFQEFKFENYQVVGSWQKFIKQKALDFANDPFGKWFFIGGQSGCVDAETEYFNGIEWKPISDYTEGESVMQYEFIEKGKQGVAKLVKPSAYIKKPSKTLWEIKTDRGSIDQCLSLDHNFAYLSSKGNFNKKPFKEVIDTHNSTIQGFYGKVITTFEYNGKGIELSDDEIRLMVAVIADGSFKKGNVKCSIRVKKERKKKRIEAIFERLGIEYKVYELNGYNTYRFYAPRTEKHFSSYWYNCSQDQLKVIADEVLHWDGSVTGKRRTFSTTSKESADFIQFVFSATGFRATISEQDRRNELHKKIEYTVVISNNKLISLAKSDSQKNKATIKEVETKDGFQYCFTVPSGNLVLRRNKRIFITGNSGKTMICTAIVKSLLEKGYDAMYVQYRQEIMKLKMSMEDFGNYTETMNRMKTVKVLYIDDLFKGNNIPSEADIRIIFELLNYRYINKDLITIISTEKNINDIISIDEAIGSRIYQRSKEYQINLAKNKAMNYRLNKGETK